MNAGGKGRKASNDRARGPLGMVAAVRDASWFERPSGHGRNPRMPRYHIIIDRSATEALEPIGPACGIMLHDEGSEMPADHVAHHTRCQRPGCRQKLADLDASVAESKAAQ